MNYKINSTLSLYSGILFSCLFTLLIYLLNLTPPTDLLSDQGASWYYWKLAEPNFYTRAVVWGLYILHQFFMWGLIFYAQKNNYQYSKKLHGLNLIALAGNCAFISLHLLQTRITYDGLAQDVSIWSSLASVAIMLIWVLLMENNRRGLFFGKPAPLPKELIQFARKYHGYYFVWAIIYTFWYHPMIYTSGHLIGFLYIFLLLLQSSLFFTDIHRNRFWTVILEASVLLHGTLVAIMQGQQMASMFFFGFLGIFVITQMHGLNLKLWQKIIVLFAYLIGLFLFYFNNDSSSYLEAFRIPFIDYLGVLILALILIGILKLVRLFQKN